MSIEVNDKDYIKNQAYIITDENIVEMKNSLSDLFSPINGDKEYYIHGKKSSRER